MKPRVFVSYARSDLAIADVLASALDSEGFSVFLDRSDIVPGESFPLRLSNELHMTDAVVALVSTAFGASSWGQAELYLALARGKTVVPLLVGSSALSELDDPLYRLLSDIQQVRIRADAQVDELRVAVAGPLRRARSVARRRQLRSARRVALPLVAAIAAAWLVSSRVDSWEAQGRRATALSALATSRTVLQDPQVAGLADGVRGDVTAEASARLIAVDPAQGAVTRLNAILLAASLAPATRARRLFAQDLNLTNVTLANEPFVNVTFARGTWKNVSFSRVTWAGVVLTGGLDMALVDARFENVEFLGVLIDGIKVIDATFRGARFDGGEVDITHFAKVRFESIPFDSSTPNPIIVPGLASFERSIIRNRSPRVDAGVMDMSMPENHTIFDAVMFVGVRFEGWFDPAWFRNSTFEACRLPDGVTAAELRRRGNRVIDVGK